MNALVVRELPDLDDEVEVVEHKGIGHPDTICDGIAEAGSRALSAAYLERHGTILHHNVDKALLVGGRASPHLGGGAVLDPIVIHLAGRASGSFAGEVVVEAARAWLRATMHALEVDHDVRFETTLRPGSADLVDLFGRGRRSNDSSVGAGYAPLSALERAVLAAADRLRALSASPDGVDIGEDAKLLAVRRGRRVELTVACAFVAPFVETLARYVARRDAVAREVHAVAAGVLGPDVALAVTVNAADDVARGAIYLTVTGTSAEAGDDGEVGRGNRVNGLITPGRPMTLEAAAGKNAVTHVGKLYNVTAHALAAALVADVPEIARAECVLASRIGAEIDAPALIDVRVALAAKGERVAALEPRIAEIVGRHLAEIPLLWRRILNGEVRLY